MMILKKNLRIYTLGIIAIVCVAITACPGTDNTNPPVEEITAVTAVTGVPVRATVGVDINLDQVSVVVPSDADNKAITWKVKTSGTTGASIDGSILKTTAPGKVTITATVTDGRAVGIDYNRNFSITVSSPNAKGEGYFSISFEEIADVDLSLTVPTLYKTSKTDAASAELLLENVSQYDSVGWRVDDTSVTGTGDAFTLRADDAVYGFIGQHYVTITVLKNGVPYNKTVPFRIEE